MTVIVIVTRARGFSKAPAEDEAFDGEVCFESTKIVGQRSFRDKQKIESYIGVGFCCVGVFQRTIEKHWCIAS